MAYAFEQRTLVRDKVQPYIVPKSELENVVGRQTRSCGALESELGSESGLGLNWNWDWNRKCDWNWSWKCD